VTAVLQAKKLSRRYGRFWALRDVDLELQAGEAVALLGANGAGKSTLLTSLATLARPSRGRLEIMGHDPGKSAALVRSKMGYVAHSTLLDDALTARENLNYYGALFGLDDMGDRCAQRLQQVGLGDRGDDRVEGFSRGMRQRLSLARALLHDPSLLILDEPFTGLDAPGCRDLAERLREERDKGTAIILATHQLERVLPWCDRVLILHRGMKVEESPGSRFDAIAWAGHLSEIASDTSARSGASA
jgi:heme ABC exporter ATP-binding subunit CcmA